jgi:3-hydroxyisobutyrate dehydrogenase-like beta-hydroxyacid dehydrogenase
MTRLPLQWRIGLVGYGEVGRILAEDLRTLNVSVAAYDLKIHQASGAAMVAHANAYEVRLHPSHAALAADSDLIISAVTASQTLEVAAACASAMMPKAWFLDFNSASPGAKRAAAALIDAKGAHYVEAAVMTSVPPHRLRVPMLLGGAAAHALAPLLATLGFNAKVVSDRIGIASATKMCRSVMIKGLEAMMIESLTTARAYGVEEQVLASLYETFPAIDWQQQATYFFQRAIQHGRRRAEEVREVARTVREAGMEPWLSNGTAERQDWMADLADFGIFGDKISQPFGKSNNWRIEADRMLTFLRSQKRS